MPAIGDMMTSALRRTRRRINETLGRDVRAVVRHRCPRLHLGSSYGGWCICPEGVGRDSIVYSFGVGEDISFDLALIERFGLHVHAFDPTPKSLAWIRRQQLPAEFHMHEWGLADRDGIATFVLPRSDFVSFSMMPGPVEGAQTVDCEVRRLSTIARDLGHDRIDILKMDIEGAEYDVIEDVLGSGLPIGQLLVEFHYGHGEQARMELARSCMERLERAGFRLFYRSPVGRECSYLRPQ